MASQPVMRKRMRELDEIGESNLFDRLSAGMTTSDLVVQLKVSKRVFYKWLKADEGRQERYYAARQKWADHLAEETLAIADGAVDAHDATVRKLRIDTRKWLAARVNPDNWADRKDPLVQVNIQDQHLSALRELVAADVKQIESDDD